MTDSNAVIRAARQFIAGGETPQRVEPLGAGNINDTYLVTTATAAGRHFVLQRINRQVFADPARMMVNLRVLSEHLDRRLRGNPQEAYRPWILPRLIPALGGQDHWIDGSGSFWRAFTFIAGAGSRATVATPAEAEEIGYALGRIHRLMSDLDPNRLAVTLPGFHVTPGYLAEFDAVRSAARHLPESPEWRRCLRFVDQRRRGVCVLERARERGLLPLRPIHGDPKADNVLLDLASGRAVAMVDLDTVQPGLVQHDLGDCLRSCCNPLGENPADWQAVRFDLDLARAVLKGYLGEAGGFLSPVDRSYIYDAIRLIAFELGLRFVTDDLAGNRYFRVKYSGQNLHRGLAQFQLCRSIEHQEAALRALIASSG